MRFFLCCLCVATLGLAACEKTAPPTEASAANNQVARCGSVTGSKLKTKDACTDAQMSDADREALRLRLNTRQ